MSYYYYPSYIHSSTGNSTNATSNGTVTWYYAPVNNATTNSPPKPKEKDRNHFFYAKN